VTDRAQSQCFPLKCNSLIQVFSIASMIKAGGELSRKIIQSQGPIFVTDRVQSKRFTLKNNSLIQVFDVALVIEADGESIRKIIQ
jgi:hypothetical protein